MSQIPQKYILFAQYLARRARACGLHSFNGTFRPGFGDGFNQDLTVYWNSGRHGADAGKVTVSFKEDRVLKVDESSETATSEGR